MASRRCCSYRARLVQKQFSVGPPWISEPLTLSVTSKIHYKLVRYIEGLLYLKGYVIRCQSQGTQTQTQQPFYFYSGYR